MKKRVAKKILTNKYKLNYSPQQLKQAGQIQEKKKNVSKEK